MAFSESNPPRMISQAGIGALSTGAASVWLYRSSDAATAVTGTGYFSGCGRGSRAGPQVGMQIGDIVLVQESSAGATNGRTTVHSVINSTASSTNPNATTLRYNVTVAAHAST
jgi:hypothetical protein